MMQHKGPQLSLCMIVRDSARTLPACLDSIAPWVDEMIVVDTGSTDSTCAIARHREAQVFEFPWCDDFARARNESLRYASGEWIFWMDSDDVIDESNGRGLRRLVDQTPQVDIVGYVMQVHCPGPAGTADVTVVDHVKMFRNLHQLRFEGRIHEQILPAIRQNGGDVCWTDIFVTHAGAEHTPDARRRKQQRDLRLLKLDLCDRPNHPFVLFNLGMTYGDMGKPRRAIGFLRQSIELAGRGESHLRKAYALLAGSLMEIGHLDEARRALDRGLELYESDPELHFRRGVLAQRLTDHQTAMASYRRAIAHQADRYFSSRDRGVTGYKARHNLAGIYEDIQHQDEAEVQWRLARIDEPSYLPAWHGLVEVLLQQQKYSSLETEIEAAKDEKVIDDIECVAAEAKLFRAKGHVHAALRMIDEAKQRYGPATSLLNLRSQFLFELGHAEAALDDLERLCAANPSDGAAYHNLGTAHHVAGRFDLAAASYERSLAVRPGSAKTEMQLEEVRRLVSLNGHPLETEQIGSEHPDVIPHRRHNASVTHPLLV